MFIGQVGDEKEEAPENPGLQAPRGMVLTLCLSTGVGVLLKSGPGGPSPFNRLQNTLLDTPHPVCIQPLLPLPAQPQPLHFPLDHPQTLPLHTNLSKPPLLRPFSWVRPPLVQLQTLGCGPVGSVRTLEGLGPRKQASPRLPGPRLAHLPWPCPSQAHSEGG